MLLQTNSYIVPKERRAEHARLLRRFRQVLLRLGCEQFEVYEQMGANWTTGDAGGRFVQIMKFRDRKHQRQIHAAEQTDPAAQQLINEFCELINLPYQQQQGLLAIGYYTGVVETTPGAAGRRDAAAPAAAADDLAGDAEMRELPPAGGGFGSPLGGAGSLAAAAGAFGAVLDRDESPAGGAAEPDDEDSDDEGTAFAAEPAAVTDADEDAGLEDMSLEPLDPSDDEADIGHSDASGGAFAIHPREPGVTAAARDAGAATAATGPITNELATDDEAGPDAADVTVAGGGLSAGVGGASVPELSPAGEVELDEEFEAGEDVPFAGGAVSDEAAIAADELEDLLLDAEARADLPADPEASSSRSNVVGSVAGATGVDLASDAATDGRGRAPASDIEPDGGQADIEDAFDGLFEDGGDPSSGTATAAGLTAAAATGAGRAGERPANGADAGAAAAVDNRPGEPSAVASGANGLVTRLMADEGEIEILYELQPTTSRSDRAGATGDGQGDEIEAALNEALRD